MEQIFFSIVPQLFAPLHLVSSHCQDNSSESFPIMRDEVGEHGTGSETISTYSISPDPSDSEVNICRFGFSSSHRFSMGFRSGDCDGNGKTFILLSVNHFCVDFEVCFGSYSCWKVQPWPILSLLKGAVRFAFNICRYLMESMIPCILTRCPGPLEEKQPHNIKDPPPYFTLGMGVFSVWLCFCLRQTHLCCLLPKKIGRAHVTI